MGTTTHRDTIAAAAPAGARARPLTQSQLRQLEAELLAERARLERSMTAPLGDAAADAEVAGDPDDELGAALRSRTASRHDAVRAAMQRLADGTYGRCTDCGQGIPFGRLLVMPESERCLACGPHI